ncbi:unnamed protein product [Cochlearia groenlandica]
MRFKVKKNKREKERETHLVKAADSSIIQEQLNQKACECEVLQGELANLKQQLSNALEPAQEPKLEELKQKADELNESKKQLEHRNRKLAEESSYAKGLASAAAVELKALSEEVARLMNHNERLAAEITTKKSPVRNNNNNKSLVDREAELERLVEESKHREAYLENELASMWVLVSKTRKSQEADSEISDSISETPQTDLSF